MIICVCRNINCSKVGDAIHNGARTPACVLAHHGQRFNCGKCRETISEMIEDAPFPEMASQTAMMAAE